MMKAVLCLIFTLCRCQSFAQNIVCYYDGRAGTYATPVLPEALQSANCTHYTYIGIGFTSKGDLRELNPNFDLKTGLPSFLQLRSPTSKLLVLLGGIYESSATFSTAVAASLDSLINNVALFLTRHNLDGVDVDWRYPGSRGGKPNDKVNFQKFLIRLRARLNMMNKLLAISVSPNPAPSGVAYDATTLSLYADMINVYAFNFTEGTETVTTNLAPMYSNSANPISVNSSISSWLSTKVRKNKLNLVVATYARSYTLANAASKSGLGAPTRGQGLAGTNSKQPGYLSQDEFCAIKSGYGNTNDATTQTTFFARDSSWVSSETADSLVQKYSYAIDSGLAGVGIYTLDWDDTSDGCGAGQFPAVQLARDYLLSSY
ncbi:chitotriosidase-1 [Culex quinquefasciatus]|uniref:chitotriosidase-1 n=1 Tax=Culex quinquefasciatus TaxID=7176 RepID=UPI0018E33869|nr:chitotriosidase-1 [Culex quinquefasciatus]